MNRERVQKTMIDESALTPDEIGCIQANAWEKTFLYAWEHSPFYRSHLRAAGFKAGMRPKLGDLRSIPPIDKDVLSRRADEFLCVAPEKITDIATTSGTTGTPFLCRMTEADLQRLAYNEYLSFKCAGLTEADTVLLGVTLDRCFIAGLAYFLGLRMLGCAILRAGVSAPAMHFELMDRVKPTAMVTVPSFARMLAAKAAEAGADLRSNTVEKIVCIGEPVRASGFVLNEAGRTIEAEWGAKTFSTYGNTELQSALCECEAGMGGHLHPELLHIETLDDEGNPVGEGEVGELTATTFGIEGMPLIRYRTGDCAAIYAAPCACGRKTARIGPVIGRKKQKLKLLGTTIFPSTLQSVLDAEREVEKYAIIARSLADLSDSVEVLVHTSRDPEPLIARLRQAFSGRAKVSPEIRPASAEEIEALQMPPQARKRRVFVDMREERQ